MLSVRLKHIDRLKGLAMLSVVSGPMTYYMLHLPESILHSVVSVYQMPLFFFLSGIVINSVHANKSLSQFVRFLMPFLVFGILFTWAKGMSLSEFAFDEMKLGYWYLYVLAAFYVLILFYSFSDRLRLNILIFVALYAVLYFLHVFLPSSIESLLSIGQLSRYFFYFSLGYFVKRHHSFQILRNHWIFLSSSLLFGAGLVLYTGGYVHVFRPTAFCGVLCLYNLFVRLDHIDIVLIRFVEYIGKHSLDVYVLHYFFFVLIAHVAVHFPAAMVNSQVLIALVCVVMACLVAYVSTLVGKLLHKSKMVNQILFGDIAKSLIKKQS